MRHLVIVFAAAVMSCSNLAHAEGDGRQLISIMMSSDLATYTALAEACARTEPRADRHVDDAYEALGRVQSALTDDEARSAFDKRYTGMLLQIRAIMKLKGYEALSMKTEDGPDMSCLAGLTMVAGELQSSVRRLEKVR